MTCMELHVSQFHVMSHVSCLMYHISSTPSSGNTTSRKSLNEEYHEDGLMGITTGLAKSLVRVVAGAPVPVPEPEIR